jgi:hypothetical protein
MESKVQSGYLILADISGYTGFMAETELEHAHEILTELIDLITRSLTSLFTLAEVEGDAVFVYCPSDRITRGETLMELVEETFTAFRDRREAMRRGTTCICRACKAIPTLDLKFITHFGSFILHPVAGRPKPVGSDINVIHRLLKNSVSEATGWNAYSLYTEQALKQLEVTPEGIRTTTETYDRLGDIVAHSTDLDEYYKKRTADRHIELTDETAHAVVSKVFPIAPPLLWDWVNDVEKRTRWMQGNVWKVGSRSGGRTTTGSANHCHHGKGEMAVERIVDWKPFQYSTTEMEMMGFLKVMISFRFVPVPEGTRLEERVRTDGPLPGFLLRLFTRKMLMPMMKILEFWDRMEGMIAEEEAARADDSIPVAAE